MSKKKFPQPSLTVDLVLFRWYRSKVELLLIKRKQNPFKDCWALPGGFVAKGETAKEAAYRELQEETNLIASSLAPLTLFDEPGRDPRGWTISMAYWSIVKSKTNIKAGTDAKEAEWFSIKSLPELSFDHDKIIDYTLNTIKDHAKLADQLLNGVEDLSISKLKSILNYI
ncbi:NUDIX domain-containing protein [Candidatus Uabimicrobium sp. HlEnr_7]|uniref:NUDIX domain-containing protein n=1 Tax=Candidatus Uabimicrobium helgolandensis TaxID=3095367 RepID=UPI003558A5BE